METIINVTPEAQNKISSLLEQSGDNLKLRIAVMAGGCAGFQYDLYFDDKSLDGDTVMDFEKVSVVVDKSSIELLKGSTVDFEDGLMGAGFTVNNPNASSGCGCGKSFC